MLKPNQRQTSFGRRLFLLQTITLLTGCHSFGTLPKIPFLEKEEGEQDPLFRVDGEIAEIRTTSNWQFMAVRYHSRTWGTDSLNSMANPQNSALEVYNIEFQTPVPFSELSFDELINPFAIAFDQKGTQCLIASGIRSGRDSGKKTAITVDQFFLKKKKGDSEPFSLSNEEWIDAVISPNADWLGLQFQDGKWEFLDLSSTPPKRVVFPENFESKSGTCKTNISRVLTFSPDGNLAATLLAPQEGDRPTHNQTIAVWDLSTARAIPEDQAKKLPLEALYVSEFQIRDTAAGSISAFSPDGQMIAVRSKQKYVGVWQTAGGQLAEFGEHRQPVTAIQFSPNNTKLAIGTGEDFGRIVIWDVRKEKLLRTYDSPEKSSRKITALNFSPDGDHIYFGNDRGGVYQWAYQSQMDDEKGKKKD